MARSIGNLRFPASRKIFNSSAGMSLITPFAPVVEVRQPFNHRPDSARPSGTVSDHHPADVAQPQLSVLLPKPASRQGMDSRA